MHNELRLITCGPTEQCLTTYPVPVLVLHWLPGDQTRAVGACRHHKQSKTRRARPCARPHKSSIRHHRHSVIEQRPCTFGCFAGSVGTVRQPLWVHTVLGSTCSTSCASSGSLQSPQAATNMAQQIITHCWLTGMQHSCTLTGSVCALQLAATVCKWAGCGNAITHQQGYKQAGCTNSNETCKTLCRLSDILDQIDNIVTHLPAIHGQVPGHSRSSTENLKCQTKKCRSS